MRTTETVEAFPRQSAVSRLVPLPVVWQCVRLKNIKFFAIVAGLSAKEYGGTNDGKTKDFAVFDF